MDKKDEYKREILAKDELIQTLKITNKLDTSKLKSEIEALVKMNKEKDDQLSEARQKSDKQKELIEQMRAHTRKSVTCKCCNKVFAEPVELPCSNSICRRHLSEFESNDCIYCSQRHELETNEPKLNESLTKTISLKLHLTEKERKLNEEIETFFGEAKDLSEDLSSKKAETEKRCDEHFAELAKRINLRRNELKLNIDALGDELIGRVEACKRNIETYLSWNLSKTTALTGDVFVELENDFNESSRETSIDMDRFETLKERLAENCDELSQKLATIHFIRSHLEMCSIEINKGEVISEKSYGILKLNEINQ